jgi:uncharacterized membrane protein YqiK
VIFVLDGKLSNSWIMLIVEVVAGILIYIILLIVMKAKIIKDASNIIRKN